MFVTDISIPQCYPDLLTLKCIVAAFTAHVLLLLSQPFREQIFLSLLVFTFHPLPSPILVHTSYPKHSNHSLISDGTTTPKDTFRGDPGKQQPLNQ